MVNRPKAIGTASETAVVRYLNANGWPHAERRAMRGIKDMGDITGIPGLVIEVKGGEAARTASDGQVIAWLHETEIERANAREHLGILVAARPRQNVRNWWAICWADQLCHLLGAPSHDLSVHAQATPVRTPLAHMVTLLRAAGWGDPIEEQDQPA